MSDKQHIDGGDEDGVGSLKDPIYYIIRTGQGYHESVDEYDTQKEADAMVQEYIISDPSASYVVARHYNP